MLGSSWTCVRQRHFGGWTDWGGLHGGIDGCWPSHTILQPMLDPRIPLYTSV